MALVVVAFHEPVIAVAAYLSLYGVVDFDVGYINFVSAVDKILAQYACF